MKKYCIILFSVIAFYSCSNGQTKDKDHQFAALPAPKAGERVATFAGGCFWALSEAMSELKGVTKVVAGFAGGTVKSPTYDLVCTRTTGHAEAVQVYYDPKQISYAVLAKAFFSAHDPTTLNRQGPDEGTDYRSAAFYRTPEEKKILESEIAKVNASHHFPGKIVTEVLPYKVIYPAENYHQGYFKLHPESSYIANVSLPKVEKMRKAMKDQLKPEFK